MPGKYPADVGETGDKEQRPYPLDKANLLGISSDRRYQWGYDEDAQQYIEQPSDGKGEPRWHKQIWI